MRLLNAINGVVEQSEAIDNSVLTEVASGWPSFDSSMQPVVDVNAVGRDRHPMIRHSLILASLLIALGCQRDVIPGVPTAERETKTSSEPPAHIAEELVLAFIADVHSDRHEDSPIEFPADFELSKTGRITAFRMLERYIKSSSWAPEYTAIHVVDGYEDSADIYLRNADRDWLLFMCGYHYDTSEWKLDAYEIPEHTFVRPENESFSAYMARGVTESRATAKPYTLGVKLDGVYYID